MARKGENIYKRKDGRWEARFIKSHQSGKAVYGSVYGKSYSEAKKKRSEAMTNLKKSAKAEAPKPAATPAASAKGGLTVGSLTGAFKKQFGAVLRIYNGRSKADDGMSLQEVGLKQEINTTFDGKQTVGVFIEQMAKAGLKVKVYTCDEWVAVLDELTLEQAGKVKKNAKKADMDALKAKYAK